VAAGIVGLDTATVSIVDGALLLSGSCVFVGRVVGNIVASAEGMTDGIAVSLDEAVGPNTVLVAVRVVTSIGVAVTA
jgi:hypothetical protein